MPLKALDDYKFKTSKLINPVTRSEIILSPPFGYDTDDELRKFMDLVGQYCTLAWRLGVIDVKEIASQSWVNDWYGTRSFEGK
jgi:hypothetical protein